MKALAFTLLVLLSGVAFAGHPPGIIQQIYWSPDVAPNQGLAIQVQNDIFFGAYYGYRDGQPSFVILVGTKDSGPVSDQNYSGDVLSTDISGGSSDVGNFTWEGHFYCKNAQPCGRLTMNRFCQVKRNRCHFVPQTAYRRTKKQQLTISPVTRVLLLNH